MSKDFGVVEPGSTLYIEFDSFGASGESITLTGLAVTDIEVYKDGSVTQRASDAGYTLLDTDGIDFDALTGIHGLSINLADNTTAGFWAAGSHYRVVISSVTINAQTVSFTAATFRIGYRAAILNTTIATLASQTSFTLTNGPAEDDALNGCVVCIHDVASAVQLGFGVISDYTGSTKTVTLTAGVSFAAAATDNISIFPPSNAAWGGAVAYTATRGLAGTALPAAAADAAGGLPISDAGGLDLDAKIGALTFTVAGDVDVNVQTWGGTAIATPPAVNATQISGDSTAADNAEAFFDGTGYAGTNNVIPTVTTVNGLAAGAITAAAIATGAIDADALAADAIDEIWDEPISTGLTARAALLVAASGGLGSFSVNDASATTTSFVTDLTSTVDDFYNDMQLTFTSGALTGQIRVISDYAQATKTITLDEALTSAPANGVTFVVSGPHTHTKSQLADAVWDEATAGHTTAGSTGKALIDTLADTNELQGDWVNGGRLDLILDATATATALASLVTTVGVAGAGLTEAGGTGDHLTTVPWNASWDAEVQSEVADALTVYDPPTKAETDAAALAAFTTQMTEAYAANGVAPTPAEALFAIHQYLMQFTIATTNYTVKKLDNSTAAFIVTLDSATAPTAAERT